MRVHAASTAHADSVLEVSVKAEPSAIELDIFEGTVRGKVIRCDGDVCSYFEYEKK